MDFMRVRAYTARNVECVWQSMTIHNILYPRLRLHVSFQQMMYTVNKNIPLSKYMGLRFVIHV